ncbi:MAG: sigma 54-interacting transcriptional regulator, partial [Thermoguttaceae bacterium]
MVFGVEQQQYAERAAELVFRELDYLESLLILGRSGVGKNAVAKALAEYLDLEFVHVPMNDAAKALRERLIGSVEQARRAADEQSFPGEFGRNRPTLLYLDKLHAMDTALAQFLQQAITQRRYFDSEGRECSIHNHLLIVAGLRTFEPEARVTPEHFACTAFPRQLEVYAPTTPEDLRVVAGGMLDRLAPGCVLAADSDDLLLAACNEPDHLHTLFRWLRAAVSRTATPHLIDLASLQLARNDDVELHLRQIDYCASSPPITAFREWQANFPEDLRPLAVVIIRQIAGRYYIARDRYWKALDNLISQARIEPGRSVVFCKWQAYGKSGPTVMQHLKNRCAWNTAKDIDLTYPVQQWRRLPDRPPPKFILTDDWTFANSQMALEKWGFWGLMLAFWPGAGRLGRPRGPRRAR